MATKKILTNVSLTPQDNKWLGVMMVVDGFDNRSAFIRKLIRNEFARRNGNPMVALEVEPEMKAE